MRGSYMSGTLSAETSICRFKGDVLYYVTNFYPCSSRPGNPLHKNWSSGLEKDLLTPPLDVCCRWDKSGADSGLSVSLVPLGLLLGLIGTFIDSILGALCQYTGYSPELGRVLPYLSMYSLARLLPGCFGARKSCSHLSGKGCTMRRESA